MNFSSVLHGIDSVLTFALIGAVGYFMAKRKMMSRQTKFELASFITLVVLPPYLVHNINSQMTRDQLMGLLSALIVPFGSIAVNVLITECTARALGIPKGRRGIFCSSIVFSNTIFIGVPVNIALFGGEAVQYALLYYFANTMLFWSYGNYSLATDAQARPAPILSWNTLRKFLSPAMIGTLTGVLLLATDVTLPRFLANACRHLGGITTALVLVTIGWDIYDIGFARIWRDMNRDFWIVALGRFVVSPLVVVVLTRFFPCPDMMFKVFIIQSSLPAMSNIAMLANFYKSDIEYATVLVSGTTIMALLTVPVYMWLFAFMV